MYQPTARNGKYITEQATFVSGVVRGSLRAYKRREKKVRNSMRALRTRVIIVTHSMGAIVARTAQVLPNYKKQSIQLGVPYEMPAISCDTEINAVYHRMHLKGGKEDDVYAFDIMNIRIVGEPRQMWKIDQKPFRHVKMRHIIPELFQELRLEASHDGLELENHGVVQL
ncbi:hypothetical protein PsorP6_013300 [Peronosclerospora sorghi]|uniref:Uncharacterized protein n=1 Tax=Peronosclerospora sorghi TaxID=230839 RepID=A0ACC0WH21_9STRA|nr:hypothetical protein PsorP6_013300 [Peronosclerospora sorghi]